MIVQEVRDHTSHLPELLQQYMIHTGMLLVYILFTRPTNPYMLAKIPVSLKTDSRVDTRVKTASGGK